MSENGIEEVLEQAGRWGKFQIYYYACLGFVVIFSVFPGASYIFAARDIKYRCYIPECENISTTTYNPEWLVDFVPYKESPSSCLRYATSSSECKKAAVLKNETLTCDTFVYQRPETTIVQDFNVTCEENLWKLTTVGTINVIGEMMCLPISGLISDRFGRKQLMIISVLLSTIVGVLRSFSPNYIAYAALEFSDTALGGGMYGAAFILAMEIVGSKDRNLGNVIICCIFSFGEAILGITAWLSPSWRIMLRVLYIPGIISIAFFWTIPESIRWLLSVKRKDEARKIVLKIAEMNGKHIDDELVDKLLVVEEVSENDKIKTESFLHLIKCKALLLRTIHCSLTWIAAAFVYYGLTIHSVAISDNIYLSFIFAVIVEIPAYLIYYYANERTGRRLMLFASLVLGGVSCAFVGFIPSENFWLKLLAFLMGKCCSTMAYTILYIYTAEMFPTNSRHLTFSVCSMFGRFGAMTAPQVPLLTRISKTLPMMLFALVACTSGIFSLLFPETLNVKLPDTVEQAVNIGKKPKPHVYEESSVLLKK